MWLVPILAVGWANVHGSFVLAPLLVAFAFGEIFDRKPAARTLLVLLATVAGDVRHTLRTERLVIRRRDLSQRDDPELGGRMACSNPLVAERGSILGLRCDRPRDGTVEAQKRPSDRHRAADRVLRSRRPRDQGHALVGAPGAPGRVPMVPIAEQPDDGADRLDPLKVAASTCIVALIPIALVLRAGIDPVTGTTQRLAADAPEVLVEATRATLPARSACWCISRSRPGSSTRFRRIP